MLWWFENKAKVLRSEISNGSPRLRENNEYYCWSLKHSGDTVNIAAEKWTAINSSSLADYSRVCAGDNSSIVLQVRVKINVGLKMLGAQIIQGEKVITVLFPEI